MKFRDGMWQVAEDKQVEYAEEVFNINKSADSSKISLLCPVRRQYSRGDSLNQPTLTIDIEAVSDGILSVETTHWHGAVRRGPNFELFPNGKQAAQGVATTTASGTTLASGSIAVTVSAVEHAFDLRFHSTDGQKHLTSLLSRSVGFAYSPGPGNMMATGDMRNFKHYVFTQTTLGVGEEIYGLGERFGAFNKVGQSVVLWNADGGTSSEQAYKNVSFWMSNHGYGVFIDAPERVELEVGSERSCRLQTSVEGQRLKWYIIYGPTPKEVLSRYTLLTGRANRVPAWSFGLWLTTSFTTEYDEKTVTDFLQGMRARDIPLEVFHYDCFWMRPFHWCDFEFMSSHFPDPPGQIARLKKSGLVKKICVWVNTYVAQASPVFAEAASKGYLLKRKNGDVFQWDLWQTGMGIVDLTNPAACQWYRAKLERLFDMGVDSIKTDFGERIPSVDVEWFQSDLDPSKMHNYYSFMYNKLVFEALQQRYGKNEAVLFARSACAGAQRFPLQWGGDCESSFEAMAESIRGGLSLGLCGFSFWSVDIGGFEGLPNPAIYKRWVAFGLMCSHSRLHGSNSYRVPWLIDDDDPSPQGASAVLRKFTRLKYKLMPYLYTEAMESIAKGWPTSMRAMALEFPEDRTAWRCDTQFMLGSRLLVAPILHESGEVEFYLPAGKWTSFWDPSHVEEGPKWVKEKHEFDSLALYVRPNTILVLGKDDQNECVFDWTVPEQREIRLYVPTAATSCSLSDAQGNRVGGFRAVNKPGAGWSVVESNDVVDLVE